MRDKKLDQLIEQMENYLECWKQFNQFFHIARGKKFGPEEENQFLEVKSVLTQELELVLSMIESGTPSREDIHSLITGAPSLHFLAGLNEATLRGLETQWHKIYIGWHSVLGQLKVKQRDCESKSMLSAMFEKKK